jgi:acyl-CoA thioesterase YciA
MDKSKPPRIRVVMMPKDTNALGSIFGGVILSHLDLAAAEHAYALYPNRYFVTKILREVDFIAPVKVGDAVSYYTETVKEGAHSVTVRVMVESERKAGETREAIKVTEAEVVMVAIGKDGKAISLK